MAERKALSRAFAKAQRRLATRAEVMLWRDLRDRRHFDHKFRRQVPIGSYVVDCIFFDARLIVELDGEVHSDPIQRAHDLGRDEWLRGQGFVVLRFLNDLILGGAGGLLLDKIRIALLGPAAPSSDPAAPGHLLPRGEKERSTLARPA